MITCLFYFNKKMKKILLILLFVPFFLSCQDEFIRLDDSIEIEGKYYTLNDTARFKFSVDDLLVAHEIVLKYKYYDTIDRDYFFLRFQTEMPGIGNIDRYNWVILRDYKGRHYGTRINDSVMEIEKVLIDEIFFDTAMTYDVTLTTFKNDSMTGFISAGVRVEKYSTYYSEDGVIIINDSKNEKSNEGTIFIPMD